MGRLPLLALFALSAPAAALPPTGEKARTSRFQPGERQRGRENWFFDLRADPDGSFPAGARANGIQRLRDSRASLMQRFTTGPSPMGLGLPSRKITNAWQFAGPQPIKDNFANSGAGFYGFGDASFKINAVAVDLTNSNTVYIGGFAGLAKSTDGGVSWNFVSDAMPSQAIGSLAIDTTTTRIIYAGTGDPTFVGRGNHLVGQGVYRSTNAGASWQQFGTDFSSCAVHRVMIDPGTSGSETTTTLYAAVRGGSNFGFWRSLNSAQTWTRIAVGGFHASSFDLALDTTTNPAALYVANTRGLYKSTDKGANWVAVATGTASNANPNQNKNSVAVFGSTVIYTNSGGSFSDNKFSPATCGFPNVTGQAFKSVDSGATFTELSDARGFCGGQCFYDQYAAINPNNPEQVFFGGVDMSSSSNGGQTVTNFAPFTCLAFKPVIHSDQHSYGFSNGGTTVYIGNDGGLYKSVNGGLAWQNMAANLPGGLFVGIGLSGDNTLIGGFQDNGSAKATPGDVKWRVVDGGDGGYNKIDPGNSSRMYVTYVVAGAGVQSFAVSRSLLGGSNLTDIVPPGALGEDSQFYPALFSDPENFDKIILGFQNIWRSAETGSISPSDTYTRIGNLLGTSGGTVTAIYEAPSDANVILAATRNSSTDNRLYRTADAGNGTSATWTQKQAGLPSNQTITDIAVHPTISSVAYVTLSQYGSAASPKFHVYKTTNGAENWVHVSTGLPDVPAIDVEIDTAAPENLFVATDVGVFNSIDGGKTWARSDVGMPEGHTVSALALNTGTRKLAAGTYGRGAFSLNLPAVPPAPAGLAGSAMGVTSITWNWNASDAAFNVQSYGLYDPAAPTVLVHETTAPFKEVTGLTPNATYSFMVTAANGILESVDSAAASTVTHAQPVSGTQADPGTVWFTSATLSFVNGAVPPNPMNTVYEVQVSTDGFVTLNVSSRVLTILLRAFEGLQANATYFFKARALNHGGHPSIFDQTASTSTLAVAAAPAAATTVGSSSFTVNWGANGNSAKSFYLAQISTDTFATIVNSSATRNTSAVFTGLASATNHQVRVFTIGNHGGNPLRDLGWVTTSGGGTTLPGAASPAFSGVNVGSLTVAWTDGGNPAGTLYRTQLSTAPNFGTINFSSETKNLAVLFGNGGAGADLLPNTTHYVQSQSSGTSGSSAFTNLGSTATLAKQPANSTLGAVHVSSISYVWWENTNPAGTTYYAQLSTDSFATLNIVSGVLGTAVTLTGLTPNTTHHFRVRAVNHNALLTLFDATVTTPTRADLPAAFAAAMHQTSMTVTWSAGANPAGTKYEASYSTNGFATVQDSSKTFNLSAAFTNLLANTTHTLRLKAVSHAGLETADLSLTTATRAGPPTGSSATVHLTSITFNWSANGNHAGTTYYAQLSTDSFSTLNVNQGVLGTIVTMTSLLSNTTYHLRARGINTLGVLTAFDTALTSVTRAATPVAAEYSGVLSSAVTPNWTANGNGPSTRYRVQMSSDGFMTVQTSVTLNTSAAFTGLPANTVVASSVQALGHDGSLTPFVNLGSTTTLLVSPSTATPAFTGVSAGSITVQWTSGGNSAGTLYASQLSTNNFSTLNFSSETRNLSVLFGNGGAGADLLPNTSYFFQVKSSAGVNSSQFVSLGSTATLANKPASTAVLSVGSTTVSVFWNSNSNPNGTTYYAQASTTDTFTTIDVTAGTLGTAVQVPLTLGGLSTNTTYFLRVRAVNHRGLLTIFDAAVSTRTMPRAPGIPGTPSGTAQGVSSITWTWTAASDAATYNATRSSDAVQLQTGISGTSVVIGPLGTNVALGLRVSGVNSSGEGLLSGAATTYTHANPPAGSTADTVHATSAAIRWGLNANPYATAAFLEYSTHSLFSVKTTTAVGFVTVSTITNLLGCTSYYARVFNKNGDAISTAYDATVVNFLTKGTTPTAPGSLTAASLTASRIQLSWIPSPTEGITSYRLYADGGTGALDYATVFALLTSTETSFTTGVLTSSAAYKFGLRATHRCGVEEKNTSAVALAGAVSSLSGIRAVIDSPASGDKIAGGEGGTVGNRVSVTAVLAAGIPSSVAKVLFQYKASTAAAWADVPSADSGLPNPDQTFPYAVSWNVTLLPWTNFDLRAVAYDTSGGFDGAPAAVTVSIVPFSQATIVESFDAATGVVTKTETVDDGAANVVQTMGLAVDGTVRVTEVSLPPDCFSTAGNVPVTVVPNPAPSSVPTVPATVGASAGVVTQITLGGGATLVTTAAVTMSYPDADDDGVIDGTLIRIADARMFSNSGLAGASWGQIETSFDTAEKTVTGITDSFSFFAVFAPAAADLSTVRVYPNPFRPNSGNANEGREYSAANPNSGILFDNLPSPVTIEIFTMSGQRVARFTDNSGRGAFQWDVKNDSGRAVASGGYLAVISSPGLKRAVKRFAVIR